MAIMIVMVVVVIVMVMTVYGKIWSLVIHAHSYIILTVH